MTECANSINKRRLQSLVKNSYWVSAKSVTRVISSPNVSMLNTYLCCATYSHSVVRCWLHPDFYPCILSSLLIVVVIFHSRRQCLPNYCWHEDLLCTSALPYICAVLCLCVTQSILAYWRSAIKVWSPVRCLASLSICDKLREDHDVQNRIPSFQVWDVTSHTSRQSMGSAGWGPSIKHIRLFYWEACIGLIF